MPGYGIVRALSAAILKQCGDHQVRETLNDSSLRQAEHYDRIHEAYAAHYYDAESTAYRERFVFDTMFRGLDLNGQVVADLACGSGVNSLSLLQRYPKARPIGFDLSDKACDDYRRLVGTEAHQVDLIEGRSLGVQADVAMVFGGLHHCVCNLAGTFETIAGLLKPGGLLLMYEPNARFFLESARRLWYRVDGYFDAETEHALDHAAILRLAGPRFTALDCVYGGGPAYFLILNSLVLRVPLGLKRRIARPLFFAESLYSRLPGTSMFPVFIARWQYLGGGESSPVRA